MMRRHLLTLFALFTGLAALQTPAQASSLETMVFDARAFVRANDAGQNENCVCPVKQNEQYARCVARERKAPMRRLPNALRVPVIMGAERALE